jgi:hypothetical protein
VLGNADKRCHGYLSINLKYTEQSDLKKKLVYLTERWLRVLMKATLKKEHRALSILILILIFALVGAFSKVMTSFNHNEHMYIAAGILVSKGQVLYKDFAYLQTPYLPLFYGGFYQFFGVTSYYLLIGKFICFIFLCISSIIIFLLSQRLLIDNILSLSIASLFLMNLTIVNPATEVSNYIMPVAFSLGSYYVFVVFIGKPKNTLGILIAGIFLAVAIGTKLTYATIVIPFVVSTLFYLLSQHSTLTLKRIINIYSPFLLGLAIGLIPMLYYMYDLESFLFNNYFYHNINTQWRKISDYTGPMSLSAKLLFAHQLLYQPNNLILFLGILLGTGNSIKYVQSIRKCINQIDTGALLALLLVITAILTALIPTPSLLQYYTMPVSFSFLLLIHSLTPKLSGIRMALRKLIFTLMIVSVIGIGPLYSSSLVNLTQRNRWSGLRVHDLSTNVHELLIENDLSIGYKIATLSPILVMESNLSIYSELSTGPFLYRIGDFLTTEQRKQFVGTSPESMNYLFNEDPPGAILVGLGGELDNPLIEYAIGNRYKKLEIPDFSGFLYIKP